MRHVPAVGRGGRATPAAEPTARLGAVWVALLGLAVPSCVGSEIGGGDEESDAADAGADHATPDDAREADAEAPGEGDDAAGEEEACAEACPEAGATRCAGDAVERCGAGAGCLEWSVVEDCAAAGGTCAVDGGAAACVGPVAGLRSKGMWVWGVTIRGNEASFVDEMAAHGVSDVFLLIKGVSGTIRHDVLDAALAARRDRGYEMRIWAWVICFDDESYADDFDTAWVDPEDAGYRGTLLSLIDETLAGHTPDGIMLDAIRYPGNADGNTAPIDSFCAETSARVAAYNAAHGTRVRTGAAVMPEFGGPNEALYGQDVATMAGPLDVIAPMVYRYNYSSGTGWIADTTGAALAEAGPAAEVWPILQNYAGDDSPTPLSGSGLGADIAAAFEPCPAGFSVFQYAQLTSGQWGVLDAFAVGTDACGAEPPPPPDGNLDFVVYHQQPLSSNDGGPFSSGASYEGWCNTASLHMVLHSFIPDLPARLRDLAPSWEGWRGGGLPGDDPYYYDRDATYHVQEFLQMRYLGYLIGTGGVGYSGIETMLDGVAEDLGEPLAWDYVPLADLRTRLREGWLAIMNNWEWGGHYFVVVWYEEGPDPSDAAQRFYYVLDPTNIESGNGDILDHVAWDRTAEFRDLIRSRQDCGSVSCAADHLGIFVLDANGVNAIYRDQIGDGTVPLVKLE
jgi:hypothetical protein